jgi:hypothetical protein
MVYIHLDVGGDETVAGALVAAAARASLLI